MKQILVYLKMNLFVDFIANNNQLAYARDVIKIERNIKLISPELSLEVETARILNNKDYFITNNGVYIVFLDLNRENTIMLFYDVRLISEIELVLFEIEKKYNTQIASEFHQVYIELLSNHSDTVGLTDELESE